MPDPKKISEWNSVNAVEEDEFFLKQSEFPGLYGKAQELFMETQKALLNGETPNKRFPEPVEQLSPKGLALLSYIYSQKDNSEAQPLIASTVDSLKHMIRLVNSAPVGTKVTLIFQPTDNDTLGEIWSQYFPSVHKTVLYLEKTEDNIAIVHIDSVSNPLYSTICFLVTRNALKNIEFGFYSEKFSHIPETEGKLFSRQVDEYQCGVFATKDAREIARDPAFLDKILSTMSERKTFTLFPTHLKGIQSKTYSKHVIPLHGDKIVTRKGKTLKETHEKHLEQGYMYHFSKKFQEEVKEFLKTHDANAIKLAVAKYDASTMDLDTLTKVYGPSVTHDPRIN